MELTKEIREILEDIVWWDTCPTEYKSKINAYLKSENETALNIDLVSESSLPSEDEVIETILKCVDIRGIDLEHYKREFTDDRSGLITELNKLYSR